MRATSAEGVARMFSLNLYPSCAMSDLLFSKIIPGGNATILLHEPAIPFGSLGQIAKRLMDPMHIQAEQVGALYVAGQTLPHLEMMGGEFCVNATRAAALVLAGMGRLRPVPVPHSAAPLSDLELDEDAPFIRYGDGDPAAWDGDILVSGMPEPVRVLACRDARTVALYLGQRLGETGARDAPQTPPDDAGALQGTPAESGDGFWQNLLPSSLYCAARVDCSLAGTRCRDLQEGVCLVHMPGMVHVLVDADKHPLPAMDGQAWKKASAAWRSACGVAHAPASGVVWHKRQGKSHRIWPAVEVRASASEHLETACGSACLALALHEHAQAAERSGITVSCPFPALDIIQPSGESLLVFLEFSTGKDAPASPLSAWIAGPVLLAAHGRAYI